MAFAAAVSDQFKQDMLNGRAFSSDTIKIALGLQANATTWNASLATYTTTGELATSNGYTQGGIALSGFTVGLSGNTAYLTWSTNPSWTATSTGFTSDCAVIYDSSNSNHVLAVLSFGSTTASGGGTFTVQLPAAGASSTITIS
jgi:hypothetical protein